MITCLSASDSELLSSSLSGKATTGAERCLTAEILSSTEVVLLRACSSATDSEYCVKSHGDCVFFFETRGSLRRSDSESDSSPDSDCDSGCDCSESDSSESCSESSISSSLGGSKMKLGDIVEGGECRKGFRKGSASLLFSRLWFKPHKYGTGVFLGRFGAGSDQTCPVILLLILGPLAFLRYKTL